MAMTKKAKPRSPKSATAKSASPRGASRRAAAAPKSREAAPAAALLAPVDDDHAVEGTFLTARDQRFLGRVMRFLVAIQTPALARKARREGYSASEHDSGWGLLREAAGATRPLDHWFAEERAAEEAAADASTASLRVIDEFENRWFPRTRAIIRRVVAENHRDAFAAAFFKDLAQQPLGPGVVGSVSTFLDRVAALETSKEPGAAAVRATLASRGLDQAEAARMRALVAPLAALGKPSSRTPAAMAAAIEDAQAAQLRAMAKLRDWFNDWGTTLRDVFNARDQIKLGLADLRRGPGDVADDAEEPTGDAPADPKKPA